MAFSQTATTFERTPWQMHHGYGTITLLNQIPTHGDASLYSFKQVPPQGDPGWEAPPLDSNNNISFSQRSELPDGSCFKQADFTYFQTLVEIPEGAELDEFEVRFEKVDDGARAYVYNSQYPDGEYIPDTDIVLGGEPETADLSSLVVAGETNRVVIVQVDDCPVDNNLLNAQLYMDGSVAIENPDVGPQTTPTPEIEEGCTQDDLLASVRAGEQSGTITLDGSCVYVLTSASNDWRGGSGAYLYNVTTIEGNGATIERSPNAPQFRILGAQAAAGTTIRDLTIRNGSSTDNGGGILALADLTLENVTLQGNSANTGGALSQENGRLAIDNSQMFDNHSSKYGGAIFMGAGTMEITDTLFGQNSVESGNGAAVFIGGGVVADSRIVNSTITDNGGNLGDAVTAWGALELRNTIIANHETGLSVGGDYAIGEGNNLYANTATDVRTLSANVPLTRDDNAVVVSDARFVDPDALDYALQQSSPAVDRGTDSMLGSTALATDAAGNDRPYTGTPVDIGAFEFQGEGGPSLSIVKQGPLWINANAENDFSLTVSNDGIASAVGVEVVDLLPAGASYVDGSATNGGTLNNGNVTWQIGTLDPGDSVLVQYAVTADQSLVSDEYRAQSSSDPTVIATGAVITTTLNDKLVAAINFFPQPDGFSFKNYGDSPDTDITTQDMVDIFGDGACKVTVPFCVLTSKAENWRTTWLKNLEGGHCAGMAMGSLNIFANSSFAASDVESNANITFDLAKEEARSYVALYAATQGEQPATPLQGYTAPKDDTPVDVLDTLIANLSDPNATDRYRLSFTHHPDDGGGGGHTVVPFAVETLNDDESLIYIYENNRPNRTDIAIRLNRTTQVWTYVGTTNPDKPLTKYRGDANSKNLWLTSWRWHSAFPKDATNLAASTTTSQVHTNQYASVGAFPSLDLSAQNSNMIEFALNGEGYLLVTRSDGQRVGFDLSTGQWISEIEGAEEVPMLLGLGFNIPPAVRIPHDANMTYRVQVASRETAFGNAQGNADINIAGPGFGMNVRDVVLNAPEDQGSGPASADRMELGVDPDNKNLTFTPGTDDAEAPTLVMAVSYPGGSDYSVEVQNVPVEAGYAVGLAYDEASGAVTVESNSDDAVEYQVNVQRISSDGSIHEFNDAVSDGGAAGARLNVGDEWDGQNTPEVETVSESTLPAPQPVPGPTVNAFVHTASADDTLPWGTTIDHVLANGNSGSLVFVTEHLESADGEATYGVPTAVSYRPDLNRWVILSADESSPVPAGTRFNVLVAQPNEHTFAHTATQANVENSVTVVDHPLANENPNALLLVTQRENESSPVYVNAPLGVYYNNETGRWSILRQDGEAMPENATFNVMIMEPGDNASVHKASAQNTSGSQTNIQHPLANSAPDALLFVTSSFNPFGRGGTLNNHPTGVLYGEAGAQWAIANVDQVDLAVDSGFNIFIYPAFTPATGEAAEEAGEPGPDGPDSPAADGPSPHLLLSLEGHQGPVTGLLYGDDIIISSSEDGTIRGWVGENVWTLESTDAVNAIDALPDSEAVAAGLADGTVQLWDVAAGELFLTLENVGGAVNAVAWNVDAQLATGGEDGVVYIWQVAEDGADVLTALEGHSGPINALMWAGESGYLLSAGEDGIIHVWDVAAGEPLYTLEGHDGPVNDVLFAGEAIVSGGEDGTVRIWAEQSEGIIESLFVLADHQGAVNAVTVSEAGLLLSAGDDGTIRVWSAEEELINALYVLTGHDGPVNDIIVTESVVTSAGDDGTLRLWDLSVEAPSASSGSDDLCDLANIPDPEQGAATVRFVNNTEANAYLSRVGDEQYTVENGTYTSTLITVAPGEWHDQEVSADDVWEVYDTGRPFESDDPFGHITSSYSVGGEAKQCYVIGGS